MENAFRCSVYDLRHFYNDAQKMRNDYSKLGILIQGNYSPTDVKKTLWVEDLTYGMTQWKVESFKRNI